MDGQNNNKILILINIIIIMCITSGIVVDTARWSHSTYLSPDYRLLWSLGPSRQDITFEVQVKTLGYVSFGFSRDGRMAGSDVVIGWVEQGQVYFQDRHIKDSPGSGVIDREPEIDPSQDYQLLLGYENNTHTVLRFRRRLNTCDYHDVAITNDTMRILWSFHHTELITSTRSNQRGVQSLYLMQKADQDAPRAEDFARIWELKNPVIEAPSIPGDVYHWCQIFKLPTIINKKHHLIRFEPIQTMTNSKHLQNIILYECQHNSHTLHELASNTTPTQCHESLRQDHICNTIIARWARGSDGFSFPPETGYPLDVNNKYFLMETEITSDVTNDNGDNSILNSGLRLYYTSELRKYDSGVLSIGIDPNWRHIIPPGQNQVISYGHCVTDCTRKSLPNIGIKLFAVITKTHRIGKRVVLKHVRDNFELPPIVSDDNVDSNYQEYRKLNVPVQILPGDHLITECSYNSSGRSAITLGGLTSREETCLVIGLYYPRQKSLAVCHSIPSLPTVLHSLGIQELSPGSNPVRIAAPPKLAGMTLESRLVSCDWNKQFQSFQQTTAKGSFNPLCWTSQMTLLPGTNKETHYPNISKPYYSQTANDQCNIKRKYNKENWPGGLNSDLDINQNSMEDLIKSKVSRSSSTNLQESLGLSRFNSVSSAIVLINSFNLIVLVRLLVTFWL